MISCHVEISQTDLMELRDLRSFVAVARSGSFTTAADDLGYTQSAVSQQIAGLELELGHQLLRRRPVCLTPAGERLVEHATRILLRVDVARSELDHLDPTPRKVVVAVCPLAAPVLLASALRELRSAAPSLQVTVRTTDPASAAAEVATGTADLALVDGVAGPSEPLDIADAGLFSSVVLTETRLVVVLAADHPLHNRARIDLDVLADAPWIAAPGLFATPGAHRLSLSAPAPRSSVVYEGGDVPTLLALVAAGHGAALLPVSCCTRFDGIATIPLGRPRLVHRTELLTLRRGAFGLERLVDAIASRASVDRAARATTLPMRPPSL
jgi:DNA-binding transcriptional LysR family regulator